MTVDPEGKKSSVGAPQPFNLHVVRDDTKNLFAVKKELLKPQSPKGERPELPGSKGVLVEMDVIKTV